MMASRNAVFLAAVLPPTAPVFFDLGEAKTIEAGDATATWSGKGSTISGAGKRF